MVEKKHTMTEFEREYAARVRMLCERDMEERERAQRERDRGRGAVNLKRSEEVEYWWQKD